MFNKNPYICCRFLGVFTYSIYPNPFDNYLFFSKLPGACKKPSTGSVMIYNLQTQALVINWSRLDFCSSFSIDTTGLPAGLYLVNMVLNNKLVQQATVLKL